MARGWEDSKLAGAGELEKDAGGGGKREIGHVAT